MRWTGKRTYWFNLQKMKLQALAVVFFMAPLGNNFVQKPDYRDNKDKGGSFTFLLLVLP